MPIFSSILSLYLQFQTAAVGTGFLSSVLFPLISVIFIFNCICLFQIQKVDFFGGSVSIERETSVRQLYELIFKIYCASIAVKTYLFSIPKDCYEME